MRLFAQTLHLPHCAGADPDTRRAESRAARAGSGARFDGPAPKNCASMRAGCCAARSPLAGRFARRHPGQTVSTRMKSWRATRRMAAADCRSPSDCGACAGNPLRDQNAEDPKVKAGNRPADASGSSKTCRIRSNAICTVNCWRAACGWMNAPCSWRGLPRRFSAVPGRKAASPLHLHPLLHPLRTPLPHPFPHPLLPPFPRSTAATAWKPCASGCCCAGPSCCPVSTAACKNRASRPSAPPISGILRINGCWGCCTRRSSKTRSKSRSSCKCTPGKPCAKC